MGSINVTWWNLENFFDTEDDPISQDLEFTAANGWTEEAFTAKRANLAQALKATHAGAGPDLLVVAEIEKDVLLEQLVAEMGSPLEVVHDLTGTSDLRGIDVAMAFHPDKLALLSQKSHVVHLRFRTRDLFEVVFKVKDTDEILVVVGSHWPSRRLGRYDSEPARITVAENIAFIVEDHVKVLPGDYEQLRAQNDLAQVQAKFETKVMVLGDFNDEPGDRSVVEHLKASRDLDRVRGETNDIDGFKETADYRAQDVFLFNASSKFLSQPETGTFFIDSLSSGQKQTNRYQLLDQLVVTRGLLRGQGLQLDLDSVSIFRDPLVATPSGRPRAFDRKTKKGTSDHLPLTAVLRF